MRNNWRARRMTDARGANNACQWSPCDGVSSPQGGGGEGEVPRDEGPRKGAKGANPWAAEEGRG